MSDQRTVSGAGFVFPEERPVTGAEHRTLDPRAKFRIGEVAERLGLSLRSIRYYEEAGLVHPAARTSGGFRMYSESDVQRLLVVMRMKPLGFSLDRMREVLTDLDVVRTAHGRERDAAAGRLADLHEEMTEALGQLERRVELAQQLTDQLGQELSEVGITGVARP
ncbi:MAG: MerR family transcriptional regulator [Mobilicoccus sp.]|nr:MerR family transcriptional regulator [Mobilicoccus sp.]